MSIVCVAVVGKENDPLYLSTFPNTVNTNGHASTSTASASTATTTTSSSTSPTPVTDVSVQGPHLWQSDTRLRYHYMVHTALDVVEEKMTSLKKSATSNTNSTNPTSTANNTTTNTPSTSNSSNSMSGGMTLGGNNTNNNGVGSAGSGTSAPELYLGLLFQLQDCKVFGFITNTKIKFLVVVQDSWQDVNLKNMFREIHLSYVNMICNPFSDIQTCLQSKVFHQSIFKIVKVYNEKLANILASTSSSNVTTSAIHISS